MKCALTRGAPGRAGSDETACCGPDGPATHPYHRLCPGQRDAAQIVTIENNSDEAIPDGFEEPSRRAGPLGIHGAFGVFLMRDLRITP